VTSQPPSGGCTATFTKVSEWQGNFQGEILVRNTSSTTSSGWTVTLTFPNGQIISQMWGGSFTQSGANVTIRNLDWNGALAPNATATAGFIASWTGTNGPPTNLTCR
jgi:alpha-L-fucosidase 2